MQQNQELAIQKAVSTVVPKPTKRDVIKATAQAVYDKRMKAYREACLKADEAKKTATDKACACVVLKHGFISHVSLEDWREKGTFRIEVHIPIAEKSLKPDYDHYKDLFKAIPKRPDLKEIHAEISAVSSGPQGVDQLLSDPVIREKLEKAGEAILLKSSAKGSITV